MTIIDVANLVADHPYKVFKRPNTEDLELTVDIEGAFVCLDGERYPFWAIDLLATDWEEVKE